MTKITKGKFILNSGDEKIESAMSVKRYKPVSDEHPATTCDPMRDDLLEFLAAQEAGQSAALARSDANEALSERAENDSVNSVRSIINQIKKEALRRGEH